MERIVIPQKATYAPVALTDLFVGAPMASRLLLGATAPGQLIAAGALGYYVGSAARDWFARRGVRPIDFQDAFGADVDTLEEMTEAERFEECRILAERMSEGWTELRMTREKLAVDVNRLLTRTIASLTDQEIITSDQIRSTTLSKFVMPGALGACDVISGDVALFADTGILEPHVIAHEFAHRKGYLKELHAQALSYFALRTSGHPQLVQAARAERLSRSIRVLANDDEARHEGLLNTLPLHADLFHWLQGMAPVAETSPAKLAMRKMYDQRMRWSGQNGVSDYGLGFTNFLYTFQKSETAKAPRAWADW